MILQQFLLLAVFQRFHNLANVLRAIARANQQRIGSFHHHQVPHADGRYKFVGTPEQISFRIERLPRTRKNICSGMLSEQFIDRGP